MNISNHIAAVAVKSDNTHNSDLLQYIWNNRNKPHLFYVNVVSVAKSGMSRKMSVNLNYKGRIIDVTHMVGEIVGNSVKFGVMKVNGGGMDMVFSMLYSLYTALASAQLKKIAFRFKAVNYYNAL